MSKLVIWLQYYNCLPCYMQTLLSNIIWESGTKMKNILTQWGSWKSKFRDELDKKSLNLWKNNRKKNLEYQTYKKTSQSILGRKEEKYSHQVLNSKVLL